MGIDPGKEGGVALIAPDDSVFLWNLPETPGDQLSVILTAVEIASYKEAYLVGCLEQISFVSPKMSKIAALKLGKSYGILIGLLTNRVAYREVRPADWQRKLNCLTRGDKKVSFAMAQRLYPSLSITKKTADALLLARYCQATWV